MKKVRVKPQRVLATPVREVMASSKKTVKPVRMMIDRKTKKPLIMCPFCDPPHPIDVNGSMCGTRLVLSAERTIYKRVPCEFCGKSDGEIVKIGHHYRHNFECSPGKILFETPPKPSRLARLFYVLTNNEKKNYLWFRKWLHLLLKRKFGKVPIELHKPDGQPSGDYAWYKVS